MPGEASKENGKKGGRPKGSKARHTLQASALRSYIVAQVALQKAPIVKALILKAKKGDILAIRELFDRAMGKAKEQVDITSGGKPLPIPILGNVSKNHRNEKDNGTDQKDSGDSGRDIGEQDGKHNPISD